jgi:superfamily I DNA/RNA helicase
VSVWTEVRRQARVWHTELTAGSGILVPADRILAAVEAQTGITSEPRPPGDALLENAEAIYDPERKRVYYSSATDPALARFHVAHEYAHHRIDAALARCGGADFDPTTPAQPETSLLGEADAYSPKERSEALANLFARELLLPRDKLRALSGASVFDAERIAHDLGVPTDLVMQQLADALLLPVERDQTEQAAPERPPDQFQREAISASDRPLRVRAGPGTGKTRTLIGRVEHLVKRGENPRGVVVLTFSNLSAQDLALRIRAAVGEAATGIWSGTFHAFGLELLRKYGGAIGLPIDLRLLDRSGSLQVLEDLLGKLHLKHYLDLSEPLRKLRFVLALISRAKDELATPADYEAHAQRMKSEARDEEAREEADRALEVARAYAAYEQRLREKGLVDFGDLIVRSIELLRNHPDIRETVRKERPHVLVDEYQDMNRTSGLLLQQLVTANRGPWVVGDVRQAIYRFRGASPINMERFGQDFPGAVTSDLGVNYRSGGRIIRTFETFGRQMTGVAADMKQLHADRGEELGSISLDVASTLRAEYEGIARRIHSSVAQGAQYGDHAILARSHTVLARLSRHLERSGVPCLYFGDFFERGEIRDLLALISVAAENGGIGLLRVCQFPQYATPARDVRRVIAWRQEHEIRMLDAIRRLDEIADLSDAGRASLARLREDLSRVDFPMSAHRFLFDFLFRRGTHLQPLLADTSVPGQQRRLAIYQLLQFAGSFRASAGVEPKRAFLAHVRRLEMLDGKSSCDSCRQPRATSMPCA